MIQRRAGKGVGAIAISPRDVNDVWVGTGEPWPRNDVLPGDGVYGLTLVVTNADTGSPGRQMLAVRGVATVHRDRAILEWFLPKFTSRMQPADPAAFARLLDVEIT